MRKKRSSIRSRAQTSPPPGAIGNRAEHPARFGGAWARFKLHLATPVNGASLAVLRMAMGLVMVLEAWSLCRPSAMMQGRIPLESYFTGADIKFHIPYEGFDWLPLLPAPWMQAVVAILALAGTSMASGLCYRASAVTVFLTFGYLFVVESTRTYWQSYYYVELLFTFLMIWMPAARRYSVDAWLARGRNGPPTVPAWTVLILRWQLVIAYFYAGVSKLNLDWLLDAVPVRWDLAEARLTTDLQSFLSAGHLEFLKGILSSPQLAYFIAYTGAAFDLSIGFLLLIRRTRMFAMILMVLFHATNHFVIYENIDWFPLVGVTTALIFLDADWPERLWNWIRHLRVGKAERGRSDTGTIAVPAVGAAPGWKAMASRPPENARTPGPLGRSTAPFVVVWLVCQALLPIRHYFIAGDARFTYEGLSFSWRLKADDHRALSVQMFVDDPAIISRDGAGQMRINWNEWHGEKVIYRKVTPGRINWQQLPEIMIVLEPVIGERVIYNPFSVSSGARTEADARARVTRIWQEFHGRQPQAVRRAEPLSEVLESISTGLGTAGRREQAEKVAGLAARTKQLDQSQPETQEVMKTCRAVRALLSEIHGRDEKGVMKPYLQAIEPFALEGQRHVGNPFLLIEDPELFDDSGQKPRQINATVWKNGSHTGGPRSPKDIYTGGEPLIIYMGDIGGEAKHLLPQACILDSQDRPDHSPYVWWNSLKDLSPSKLMHVSNQAFYLRRYARRVASLWEKDYARRPVVNATTAVSLNGRPFQLLVDPEADLASVPLIRFGHNPWVKDMEFPRIPREALANRRANRSN